MHADLPLNDPHAMHGRFVSHLTRSTYAIILAGGRGSRLMQLTDWRSKPAVPFGGKFRILDFTLSKGTITALVGVEGSGGREIVRAST